MNLKSRYPNMKVILSIGGATASSLFAQIASSDRSRQLFSQSVRQLVDRHHFDGIDSMSPFLNPNPRAVYELIGTRTRVLSCPFTDEN